MVEKAEREKNLEPVSEIGLSDTFNMVSVAFARFCGVAPLYGRIPVRLA